VLLASHGQQVMLKGVYQTSVSETQGTQDSVFLTGYPPGSMVDVARILAMADLSRNSNKDNRDRRRLRQVDFKF
jgi:hypothetical protein